MACWGANDGQQLGNPNVGAASAKPTKISPPLPATSLTAGNALTCAVSAGGTKCWGRNFGVGRLGNGVADSSSTATPTSVCTKQDCSTLLAGATGVTTYDESVCAVAGGAGAVAVASGGGANYAIVVDGANRNLRCWGQETSSQCGTGTPNADRRSPVVPKW